jgi:biopolymer transport protein ExbD
MPENYAAARALRVSLNGQVIDRTHLESQLAALFAGRSDRLVLFDAEDEAAYADAVAVMDAIRRANGRIGVGFIEQPRNTRMHD